MGGLLPRWEPPLTTENPPHPPIIFCLKNIQNDFQSLFKAKTMASEVGERSRHSKVQAPVNLTWKSLRGCKKVNSWSLFILTIYETGHEQMCLMPYANNKGADQPAHPRSLISAFVVRCLDSIISLDPITEIQDSS